MSLRDPALDAVLTAETILGQFKQLLPRLTSMMPVDVSTAVGEAQSLYPELWSALDRARAVLRERGVDVPVYDEARARQPASMLGVDVKLRDRSNVTEAAATVAFLLGGVSGVVVGTAIDAVGSVGAKQGDANRSGLRDAKTALDALIAAMPTVEWAKVRRQEAHATADALEELSVAKSRKVALALAVVAVLGLVGFGLVKLLQSSRAPTKEETAAKANAEYRVAQEEIRELNDVLRATPCDAKTAERRVSLFQTHQQTMTGKRLAKKFLEQCGENAYMRSIAGPPSPASPPASPAAGAPASLAAGVSASPAAGVPASPAGAPASPASAPASPAAGALASPDSRP
ncbi:MAG: hypothetical protein ACKV2T_09365 [Kofleriaceae bacterium]